MIESSPTTTTGPAATMTSLLARGVAAVNAEQLTAEFPAGLIAAWCEYARRQRHMGPGALVDGIRSRAVPPVTPHRPSTHDQAEYGYQIGDWLRARMPDVCKPDPKVVAATRRVYGDVDADKLAAETNPHYAAVATIIRLHYQQGKGSITVREHAPVIRAAVRAADQQAIADYEAIEAARTTSQQEEVAP